MAGTRRPALAVSTPSTKHASENTVDDTPTTGSSMLRCPFDPTSDSASPIDEFQALDLLDDSCLTPITISPLEQSHTVRRWGPPGLPNSFEYKRWFNAILLHDLEGCIAHVRTYATDRRRTEYTQDINKEVEKRETVVCECLNQLRHDIKKAIQSSKADSNPAFQDSAYSIATEQGLEHEVEAWMSLKSHLAVELFCSYDETMRRACGTWKQGSIEEPVDEIGKDWMTASGFERLLDDYQQLIMR